MDSSKGIGPLLPENDDVSKSWQVFLSETIKNANFDYLTENCDQEFNAFEALDLERYILQEQELELELVPVQHSNFEEMSQIVRNQRLRTAKKKRRIYNKLINVTEKCSKYNLRRKKIVNENEAHSKVETKPEPERKDDDINKEH